jgi:hypothetical protein
MERVRTCADTLHKDRIFEKKIILETKEMVFKNGVINIRAAIHELLPNRPKSAQIRF